uniref:(northern house mosquito) hypothetical protein n=1 Tax=Culex pipiens TaxID=7175 RepID=A0A8D8B9K8_CULPI
MTTESEAEAAEHQTFGVSSLGCADELTFYKVSLDKLMDLVSNWLYEQLEHFRPPKGEIQSMALCDLWCIKCPRATVLSCPVPTSALKTKFINKVSILLILNATHLPTLLARLKQCINNC